MSSSTTSVISEGLRSKLQAGAKMTVIVKMARDTQEALDKVDAQNFTNRDERANAVTSELQALATESQKYVKEFLDAQTPPVKYNSLWISNTLVVYEADWTIIQQLEQIGGIKEMREEHTAHIMGMGAQ